MEKDKFEAFKEKFEKVVTEKFRNTPKFPSITIDSVIEIEDLNQIF